MPAIWKGSISFGLVNVPVELRAAVNADHISFRLLHAEDNTPVKYDRVREDDGESVEWGEVVKGYEYAKGKFVVLTKEDFKAAAVEQSQTIDILDFVPEEEIEPRYFDTPYFLVAGKGGDKTYALLREAIRETKMIGIGKIIMRQSQHLAGLRVEGNALVLSLMRFANEIVPTTEYNFPAAKEVRPAELKMAVQLVKSLSGAFEPEKYTDEYRENLMRIIKAKSKGKKIDLEAPVVEKGRGKVLDLMERLQQSLAQRKSGATSKKPVRLTHKATKQAAKQATKQATTTKTAKASAKATGARRTRRAS